MRSFVGSFTCTLDAKGRIMIPARFRRLLPTDSGEVLVLSKGKEQCLNLFPSAEWERVIERLENLPPGQKKRNLIRFYSDKSQTVNLDKAGRVAISPPFLSLIDNPRRVVVIGALTYMEIWSEESYEQVRGEALDTYLDGDWEY
ncbi:MAG: division/cell wall cluster transcriptional repressor MraZ [Candidatus Krumholzibacteriota bacterium]|nr:division/cell wall cluster transcriptional repressor MraZ [Candidatus Krumholzibacteriota bacterium]